MWKPGQSGNPKGRPRSDDALAHEIREALARKGSDRKTHLRAIVEKAITQARRGDGSARQWLSERGFGKALQPVTGSEGGPLEVRVTYADRG